jgi:DNA-binding LytR/AlgR family response regulator
MITTTQMYWIAILDNITVMAVILSTLLAVGTLAAFGFACSIEDHWWLPITASIMLVFFMAVGTFVPSTKQMAAILVVPKIVNSEKLQTAGNKLYELAVEWMDELRPEHRRVKAMPKAPGSVEKRN